MTEARRSRVPEPLVLLSACILLAALASWVLPAGEFERHELSQERIMSCATQFLALDAPEGADIAQHQGGMEGDAHE